MLSNFLNLEGVEILSKQQQRNMKGGEDGCIITVIHNGHQDLFFQFAGPSEASQTAAAHTACAGFLGQEGVSRCFYDCSFDDFESLENNLIV